MLLRIAYCDDEIENGKKIRDYIYLELYYWKM